MAVLKYKMEIANKTSEMEMKSLHDTKQVKTSKMVQLDEIYHKIILVTLNQSYLIINELVLKGTEMGGGWGKSN